jgi:hypothetical protein
MKDIAADFGVTPTRISQLCAAAVLRLRAELTVAV